MVVQTKGPADSRKANEWRAPFEEVLMCDMKIRPILLAGISFIAFNAAFAGPIHTADNDGDRAVSLSELLRVIQFYNSQGYHCDGLGEDGYAPGTGDDYTCLPHDSDYQAADWRITLSELLRLIQFYNSAGYFRAVGTEDGFAPDPGLRAKSSLAAHYTPFNNTVLPDAPGYTLPLSVGNVMNYEELSTWFGLQEVQSFIETNGFAVREYDVTRLCPEPAVNDDIILPYQCLNRANRPIFITSDSLLHLYHVQFDESLKEIEEREFIPDITALTASLLEATLTQHGAYAGDLQEAARRNLAYLAVAQKLLEPAAEAPALVADAVAGEIANIEAHAGFAESDIFIYEEDYSQYVPRGHYTRGEPLERYFKAMMWYGRLVFLLKGDEDWGPDGNALVSVHDARIQTLQAVLLAEAIENVAVGARTGRQVWDRIYAITAFYVGTADDLTPYEYLDVISRLFGEGFTVSQLEDETAFFDLKAELSFLRAPRIYGGTGNIVVSPPITPETLNETLDKTKGMRFMGQRFIPDSYMFQHLVFSSVKDYTGSMSPPPFSCGFTGARFARCYPRGLDIMAILGSALADTILEEGGDTDYIDFDIRFTELKEMFNAFDITDWNQNLYWGWLYALKALLVPAPEGAPNFMRTDAWRKKELNAALASWTELRHDTILYAKQSYEEPESEDPEPPPGYVEPVPEFYGRLMALAQMTRRGLDAYDALSETARLRLERLEALLQRLIDMANKELVNESLSEEDVLFIKHFGDILEGVVLGVEEEGVKTTLVADVHTHTAESSVLEEGVGNVDLIFMACPTTAGDIFLAIGPVLSYYEFKHPMSDRLTDEAWRAMLAGPDRPPRPEWYAPLVN